MRAKLLSRYDIGITKNIWFLANGNAEHEDYPGVLSNIFFGQTLYLNKDKYHDIYFTNTIMGRTVIEKWMIAEILDKDENKPKTIEEILDKW